MTHTESSIKNKNNNENLNCNKNEIQLVNKKAQEKVKIV